MTRIVHASLCALLVLPVLAGCSRDKGGKGPKSDPIIQSYMQERSNLLAQRRRLAATYGDDSPTVGDVDRQVRLVDEAIATRRRQVMEDEYGRQEMRRIKSETTPLPTQPADTQSAR